MSSNSPYSNPSVSIAGPPVIIGPSEQKRENQLRVEVLVCPWPDIAGCVFLHGLRAGWRMQSSGGNKFLTSSELSPHSRAVAAALAGSCGEADQLGMAESKAVLWGQVSSVVGLGCALELQEKLPHSEVGPLT